MRQALNQQLAQYGMIVIVDYGVGNSGSVKNMLGRIGAECVISSDPRDIRSADRLILPGVGAFDRAMAKLLEGDLVPVLTERVIGRRVPILGICLGMQLLTRCSEEGQLPGLGWIPAHAEAFRFAGQHRHLPLPNMGWRAVEWGAGHPLTETIPSGSRYYFAHSYRVVCDDVRNVLGTSTYGHPFHAAVVHDNIVGTQFHPEKSLKHGMHLLRSFATFRP